MRPLTFDISGGDVVVVRRDDGATLTAACNGSQLLNASELLAASLGACVMASLIPLLARHGADVGRLRVGVAPRGESLDHGLIATITLPVPDAALLLRCRRAATACPVRSALNIPIEFEWQA